MSDLGIKLSRKLCVKWKCSSALRVVRTKFDICVFLRQQARFVSMYVLPTFHDITEWLDHFDQFVEPRASIG
jgi:hypothetical protein